MISRDLLRDFQQDQREQRLVSKPSKTPSMPKYVKTEELEGMRNDYEARIKDLEEQIRDLIRFRRELRLPPVIAMPTQRSLPIPVPVDQGGTGATSGTLARISLGIGTDGDTISFGLPDVDGSWRIRISSANLVIEKREAGSWVEKGAFLP